MNQYLALLRGVNVGGNNAVSMKELKALLEENGYRNVLTLINSGNVIFNASETNTQKVRDKVERILTKKFGFPLKIFLLPRERYEKIIKNAPNFWGKDPSYKHNLVFVRESIKAQEVLEQSGGPKDEYEKMAVGDGVIYLSASIPHLSKTNFIKLIGKPIYQHMTIRNYNTSIKLLALLDIKKQINY